jgi:hypothetical protein
MGAMRPSDRAGRFQVGDVSAGVQGGIEQQRERRAIDRDVGGPAYQAEAAVRCACAFGCGLFDATAHPVVCLRSEVAHRTDATSVGESMTVTIDSWSPTLGGGRPPPAAARHRKNSVDNADLPGYLNELCLRCSRRAARHRGLVLLRLPELAVAGDPVRRNDLTLGSEVPRQRPPACGPGRHPTSAERASASRPWRSHA